MRKILLAGMALAMVATPALAQTYRFVIVPKAMNNPFFDFARDGYFVVSLLTPPATLEEGISRIV